MSKINDCFPKPKPRPPRANPTDPDTVMRTLAHELGTVLGKRILVRLVAPGQTAPPSPDISDGNGQRR